MLSAYLYKARRGILKSPIKLVLVILAIAFSVLMINYPKLMAGTEDAVVRDVNVVSGGVLMVSALFFIFMFYSGVKAGLTGFSMADVNFQMAGPFSPKFNLLIAAKGGFMMCIVMLWVLSCQVAVLYQMFGFNTADMVAIIVTSLFTSVIGYFSGALICAVFDNKDKIKRTAFIVVLAVCLVFVGLFLNNLAGEIGGFDKLGSYGYRNIFASIGDSELMRWFPVAGWSSMVYNGILVGDMTRVLIGGGLVLFMLIALVIGYLKCDMNYYETAIANAQKVADLKEASKSGVDTDTARLNSKVKVGKEIFSSGWGASALGFRHLFENKRATKLFFVNPLAILYRVITAVYMFIMTSGGEEKDTVMYIVMGLTMMTLLNAIVYGGGKTVLEFNRQYIFMIPEKASSKLFHCLLADLPEIAFDSALCAVIIGYFTQGSVMAYVATFIFMVVFDYLCELVALLQIRIMRSLGRVLLIMVRYFIVFALIAITMIPGFIIGRGIANGLLVSAGFAAIVVVILLACSKNVIDKVEFNK